MISFKKYWEGLSERKQAGIRFAGIGLVLILTLWVGVSVISYIGSWRYDQSALGGEGQVQNAAATSGLSLGHLLVTESFGLAAFCILAFLLVWSIKILWKDCPWSLKKWFYGSLTGTFLLSWILSLAGDLAGLEYAFGGGLGGRAGAAFVGFLLSKTGEIVTIALLLALSAAWCYCLSRRFSDLLMGRQPEPEEIPEPDPVSELPVETTDTLDPEEEVEEEQMPAEEEDAQEENPRRERKPRPRRVKEEGEDSSGEQGEGSITVITDDTLEQEVKEPLKPIDNRLDPPDGLPKYKTPALSILGDYTSSRHEVSEDELVRNNTKIRNTLASYKIQVRDVTAVVGPTVTLYKVYPAPGVKISAIKQLQEDIGINLNARGVRITTLSDSVGIEVANDKASIVPLKNLLTDESFRESKAEMPVAIGYIISQQV